MARVRIEFPETVLFHHDLEVRVSDLNYGNHLGHDSMVSLVHEARARFFRSLGGSELDLDGVATMIVDLAVQYLAEVRYGQTLRIEVAPGDVGSRGCELLYRVTDRDTGAVAGVAKTGLVFVDLSERALKPVPGSLRRMVTDE